MKAYTKIVQGGKENEKNKLCLLVIVDIAFNPMSQVKADWKRDNVGWWYSLNNGSIIKTQELY